MRISFFFFFAVFLLNSNREAQDEMKSDPKLKRVIPQEVKVSESFPEKVNSQFSFSYRVLDQSTDGRNKQEFRIYFY